MPVDIGYWIVVIVVAVLVALLVLGRRGARSGIDPTKVSIDAAVAADVKRLYAKGDKLQAVKVLRTATGLGLADAVRIADKLGATAKPVPGKSASSPAKSVDSAIGPDHHDQLRSLVADGRQAEAIALVRKLTGMSLQDATDYVHAL